MPLKFIRLQKLAATDVALYEPGLPGEYVPGTINPDVSLPLDYWLIGWLVLPPKVGEAVMVLRIVRNGIVFPGHFATTPVTEIRGQEFLTVNSIYRWEELC
jgi:hypothetical protein